MSSALQASSALKPSTSRIEMTIAWLGGSPAIAAPPTAIVSSAGSRSSGPNLLGDGAAAHVHARDPQHRRAVLPDQAPERRLVTGAKGLDDRGLDRLHRKTVTNTGRAGQWGHEGDRRPPGEGALDSP